MTKKKDIPRCEFCGSARRALGYSGRYGDFYRAPLVCGKCEYGS